LTRSSTGTSWVSSAGQPIACWLGDQVSVKGGIRPLDYYANCKKMVALMLTSSANSEKDKIVLVKSSQG
jgi:hypothetical protein